MGQHCKNPLCILLVIFLLAGSSLWAQTTSLSGRVTDQTGGVIPGAEVTVTNQTTGAQRLAVSDDEGEYTFAQLPPGTYEIKAEMAGFKSVVIPGVNLRVDVPEGLDLELEVGQVTEVVTVTGTTQRVNKKDASMGAAFSELKIRELPLLTRNVVQLLSVQAGVNSSGEVLGGKNDQNNVTLDGIDVNDQQVSGAFESVLPIPIDSVQEFRVTTVGANADQGRSSGGQVSLVTKSGSNDWHGSVYEFHRNTKTAANRWFNNATINPETGQTIPRENLLRNQFGFSVGGPVIKDRVFFFFNWEQRLDVSGRAQTRVVPSENMRNGVLTFRASDGSVQTLSAEEVALVDPLGLGSSQSMLSIFKALPSGNRPEDGLDNGLNFTGLRFNAPFELDRKAYVAKFDFNLTEDGNHAVSWRGTLADNVEDNENALSMFPGDGARSQLLDNSRGFSAQYNAVLSPSLINTFNYGFTRQGFQQSGIAGDTLFVRSLDINSGDGDSAPVPRALGRIVPVHNIGNDLTWLRGNHNFQAGINFRFINNDRFTFTNSFTRFVINNGAMFGLGNDIVDSINTYLSDTRGVTIEGLNQTPVIRAMMGMLGTISDLDLTYQFQQDGSLLPRGTPQVRNFEANEWEFYFQDQWNATPDLTFTFGIRYSLYEAPFETGGFQVGTSRGVDEYFVERAANAAAGIPSNASPLLTYDLIGPVNDRESWFATDKNSWAPRLAVAWNPGGGKNVFRAGAGVVYDRIGGNMIVNFDDLGSVGVATNVGFSDTFDFSTAPRFDGSFPALPPAPQGGFPNTPPVNFAVLNDQFNISPDIRTPYAYTLNATWQRELPNNMALEVGYIGRLARKTLAQLDIAGPLYNLLDPASGQNWADATGIMRDLFDAGLTQGAVETDPTVVPTIPYAENIFPGLKDWFIPGSASANLFWFTQFLPESEGDILHALDRGECRDNPTAVAFGCHTFFALQTSTMPTWFSVGNSNFHGMTLSLNRQLDNGLAFGFNYTWSHSIDNESGTESFPNGATSNSQFGGVILDIFNQGASRASSDFDIRQQFNTNVYWEVPFGRSRPYGGDIPTWVDAIVGGWQVTGLARFNTGLPEDPGTGFNFTTNYFLTGNGILTAPINREIGTNSDGSPSFIAGTSKEDAIGNIRTQRVGETGPRNSIRLANFFQADVGISKSFNMPWEGHRIQFRWEMFNAFNNVNFLIDDPIFGQDASLSPFDSPSTFGEFFDTTPPRVMQFALRYEF